MSACDPILKETFKAIRDFTGKDKIDTISIEIPDTSVTALKRALNIGATYGSYGPIRRLPVNIRQDIVNLLFNSRDFEKAIGLTGNQTLSDVNYFGITTRMKPLEFLNLALRRTNGVTNVQERKKFANYIVEELAKNINDIKIGPPKLWLDIRDGKLIVKGHEGRHRSDAIMELLGNDIKIPVDVQFTENGKEFRGRYITNELFDKPLVTQNGEKLNTTLRTLFGSSILAMLLNISNSKEARDYR